jgi:hypothetical protein
MVSASLPMIQFPVSVTVAEPPSVSEGFSPTKLKCECVFIVSFLMTIYQFLRGKLQNLKISKGHETFLTSIKYQEFNTLNFPALMLP